MKYGGKALVLAVSGVVLSTATAAVPVDPDARDAEATSPYHGITERNVFNLKDPPPPPGPPAPPPVPVPKIELTIITTIFGDKRAGLKWTTPPKPGEQPKVESPILSVGQAEAGVEVLDIDENEGVVKIKNHDQPQTLSFKTDGAKPTMTPLPTGAPPIPIPAPQIPVPGAAANPVIRTIPQRTLRLPPTPGQAIATPNAQAFAGQANPQQPELTPEQQALIIEAQRKYYQDKGDPVATILPPTSLTPRPAPRPGQNQPQSQ